VEEILSCFRLSAVETLQGFEKGEEFLGERRWVSLSLLSRCRKIVFCKVKCSGYIMKKEERSITAELAAYERAKHLLYDDPIMFEDSFAIEFISPRRRRFLKNPVIGLLMRSTLYRHFHPVRAKSAARSHYTEDKLEKTIAQGMTQYVIMGAGYDSFALRRRDLSDAIRIFELDHPATQKAKKERLSELNVELPKNLELIPVDFEKETIAEVLKRSSYIREVPTFFSCLGTIHFLTRDAVFKTLRSLPSLAAPGSEIIFDYSIPDALINPKELKRVNKNRRLAAHYGEPVITHFDPHILVTEMEDLGLELIENLSPNEQKVRYFANRKDNLIPSGTTYIAHFRVRRLGGK
jgi:methyltransferase (TIGR00027 family)